MVYIPSIEIKQPDLHADTLGFTFIWRGHFLRGIYPESENWAKGYFDSGFVNEIVEKGLFPKTWISDFVNDQFCFIIEHELISPVLYATEWNSAMLKEASLMILDVAEIGFRYGYNMVDCHKMNVMFKDNHPLYVDLGSFIPNPKGSTGWIAYKNYMESYTYILDMWTHGCSQLAKRMMSPGVTVYSDNYLAWKFPFFRHCNILLQGYVKFRDALNRVAVLGTEGIGNKRLLFLAKRLVDYTKLAGSQRSSHLRNKIKKFRIYSAPSIGSSAESGFDKFVANCSLTCINIEDPLMIDHLHNLTDKLISLNENDSLSNSEYLSLKGITSVSYPLFNGSFYVKGKTPEPRLCSDIVLANCGEGRYGRFSEHNSIVYLKACMQYSTNGIMYVLFQHRRKELMSLIRNAFTLEWVSENGLFIKCREKKKD